MHFVLYDRELSPIGNSYILESWSRTQRAVDFDSLKVVGEQIPYSVNPYLVVINDKQGRQLFSGLASTPVIDEAKKKTSIVLKDYMTLFNTEIMLNWTTFSGGTVKSYIDFILEAWQSQSDLGFSNISWNTSALSNTPLDKEIFAGTSVEHTEVYPLILDVLNYYNLFCTSSLNMSSKSIEFVFEQSFTNTETIRLSDFGVTNMDKSFGECNRATVYDSNNVKQKMWALTMDNSIVALPSDKELVFPGKNKNFVAEEGKLVEANYDAVTELAANRYQENIDIDVTQYRSILDLSTLDFTYKVSVYTDEGYYKDLPVGEIETDSSGKHIVRLGYRIQELTQEI